MLSKCIDLFNFLYTTADNSFMSKEKSLGFRISDQFDDLLKSLCDRLGQPKTVIIEQAVRKYADGDYSDLSGKDAVAELTAKLNALASDHEALKKELNQIKTLIIEIIEKLQEKGTGR
jgi:predicted DNA-binding protein